MGTAVRGEAGGPSVDSGATSIIVAMLRRTNRERGKAWGRVVGRVAEWWWSSGGGDRVLPVLACRWLRWTEKDARLVGVRGTLAGKAENGAAPS